MDRSLDLDVLAEALGAQQGLPTPEELQRRLADAEVQLFLRQTEISQDLLDTAWYLHAVASVDRAHELYTVGRQRRAFVVSAHIFDLTLEEQRWSRAERLKLGFAAAVGYRRGDRDPNATAILRRLRDDVQDNAPVREHLETLAIEAGLAFLGFETQTLFNWLGTWRRELSRIATLVELRDLTTTAYGTTHAVILGCEDLLYYLARGNAARLDRARTRLLAAALGQAGPSEPHARWVAAHLLSLATDAQDGSVWSPQLLPPDIPNIVRQAFTLASPPVLTLWRPQRELLTTTPSPFDPSIRRMVLSVPTSGGKTLIAQLLTVAHLATGSTSVCYVAPTRSLGREVRRAMGSRLRILQKETAPDLPDFPALDALLAEGGLEAALAMLLGAEDVPPDVEIMTPERLSHLLRHDAQAILNQFGMFIFDEAQLIKEKSRGFTLESIIAFLHYRTRTTPHRIMLISAALGNAGQIAHWIGPDDTALLHESEWRGPRRLDAAFSTDPMWGQTTVVGGRRGHYPYRLHTPVHGLIRLRLSDGRQERLSTTRPIGNLVRKSKSSDTQLRQTGREAPTDPQESDKQYVIAARMITVLGHAGITLVVAATRVSAQRLAGALAAELPEDAANLPLVEFVRGQLGEDHPLVASLRHGVGFHHAGLPIEVLEALEDAVRSDTLRYLTCTSTLTDGVNLPVRTVVIYDESYEGMPDDARLRGARLVNAMGRAGRAGKETEGWIVLVRAATPRDADFDDLSPTAVDLTVTSTMVGPEAWEAFALLEEQGRVNQDAIFTHAQGVAADFVAFIWFVLAAHEATGGEPTDADLPNLVASMLAAQQADENDIDRWIAAANAVREAYVRTDPSKRRRWPRTGTSIGTASRLDTLAAETLNAILSADVDPANLASAEFTLEALSVLGVIDAILKLPENQQKWRFRTTTRGTDIVVSPAKLLRGWIEGKPLADLATEFLSDVKDPAWRIEQLVDAVTKHFEHYLSWTLGAFIELVNGNLEDAGSETRICPELGAYVRYGVNHPSALALMAAGLRSRRLAHEIVRQLPADTVTANEIRTWLSNMNLSDWRTRFGATPPEVLDLLDITRVRGRSLLRSLLETGEVSVELRKDPEATTPSEGSFSLRHIEGEDAPAPIGVYVGSEVVATVCPGDQADITAIMDTGLALDLELQTTPDSLILAMRLTAEE